MVTFRFENRTREDVYYPSGWSSPFGIQDPTGRFLPSGHFCWSTCGDECECAQCGSPQSTVELVRPGGAREVRWHGDFFEHGRCNKGCGCVERRFAPDGPYVVVLDGRRGAVVEPGSPPGAVTLPGLLDPKSSQCLARAAFHLRSTPQTIEVPFACASAPGESLPR
jgi:hypothetical protein